MDWRTDIKTLAEDGRFLDHQEAAVFLVFPNIHEFFKYKCADWIQRHGRTKKYWFKLLCQKI
ncbi:hypothetical protein VSQ48_10660 [Candidatus Ventrimonas sp. KK005]